MKIHPAVYCYGGPLTRNDQEFSLQIEDLTFQFSKGKEGWDVDFDQVINDQKMKRFLDNLYETNPKYFSEDYETTFAEWWEENPKGGRFYLNDGRLWNATLTKEGEPSLIIYRQELNGTFVSMVIEKTTTVTWESQ